MNDDFTVDKVENVQIVITKVSVDLNPRDPKLVDKVSFKTEKGDITFRPKETVSEFQEGIEINKVESLKLANLPQKIKDIASACSEKGKKEVKGSYSALTKTVDNEKVTYRYIYAKDLENWEL